MRTCTSAKDEDFYVYFIFCIHMKIEQWPGLVRGGRRIITTKFVQYTIAQRNIFYFVFRNNRIDISNGDHRNDFSHMLFGAIANAIAHWLALNGERTRKNPHKIDPNESQTNA